jgi:mannuronan 5-epimerase
MIGAISILFAQTNDAADCINYNSLQKLIHISCKTIHLNDIYTSIKNTSILDVENNTGINDSTSKGKVWILSAGIIIEKKGELVIDSTDTTWLKIVPTPTLQKNGQTGLTGIENDDNDTNDDDQDVDAISYHIVDTNAKENNSNNSKINAQKNIIVNKNNGDSPNGIHVFGSLRIDSVKITSWDPEKKEVITFGLGKRPGEELTKSRYDTVVPRPFIRVSNEATGMTNITNSEIAYLGYSCSRCSGISYYGGIGSTVKGNNIHHLLKGFYSKGMGPMVVENNTIHDNYLYGIDPHTGTHDMIIRNNKVYENNASAIICSKHCYDLLIEGNEVYNNGGANRGIALSINTTHSTVRNNYVHDQISCIGSNRGSNYNTIENNLFSNCKMGINLLDTSNNIINNNNISGARDAIVLSNSTNNVFHNKIENSTNGIVLLNSSTANQTNVDKSDKPEQVNNAPFLDNLTSVNQMTGVKNPVVVRQTHPIIQNESQNSKHGNLKSRN